MGAALHILLLIAHAALAAATKAAWFSEWTVVRGQAELPCLVPRPTDPNDKPLLALWYKENQPTVPIYSYDTRSSSFSDGERWTADEYFGTRAFFRIMSDPPTLVVDGVQVADEAVYTCRVDYKVRPSAITKVNLTVIVPPGPPTIVNTNNNRDQVINTVGPLEEGAHTELTCKSAEGSPTPTLTWWRDGERLDQLVTLSEKGVASRISVVASRSLQGATLTCQALNNNITEPSSTSVTINVLLKPLSVEIVGDVGTLSAGRPVELVCRAVGSRPPARITWWRGARNITEVTHTDMNNGNVTTGSIVFRPTRHDDGRHIRCSAANPSLAHSKIEDSVLLSVRYKPEVELALGPALDPEAIKEGDDVYFDCTIHANPPARRVTWFHNGEILEANRSAGLIISDHSLVLQKVRRERAGVYTCAAHNREGKGVSNSVKLNVMFAPVCSSPGRRTQGVARMESAKVVCQVEAFPHQVNFTWRFNGSSEGEALPLHAIKSQGTSSMLNYTASMEQDYGTLLCWAANKIGIQKDPCVIHLIPAGPPDPPRNCSIANQTSEALVVECTPGFDGGLPQHFVMEAWDDGALLSNTSSLAPEFVVRGLEAGMGVTLKVRATNPRGQSASINLEADIMKVAEKRMGPPEKGVLIPPVVGAVVGGVGAVLVLVVAGLVLTHYTHRSRPQNQSKSESPPTLTNVYVGGGGDGCSEDAHSLNKPANPDVVRGTGQEAGGLEESGSAGAGVGTGVGAPRCVEAVAILQGNTVAGVTTTLPNPSKGMDVEYVEVMSGAPVSSGIRRREEPVVYTSLAPHSYQPYPAHVPQMVVNPRDYGRDADCCMPTTTSLHDLAGVLHPARSHHSAAQDRRRDEGVNVYGTIRRGGDRAGEGGAPPHPRAVGTFLATSHQESAV
ncbi:nephrin-like [Portunus trituberculatus]|uniref:nephrin-like n=1 Tax=Portunus trituberculatus TaxID=210409 RepID=UPI001E1CFCDD|nr:nephrin-like [Portunus trituberculatus]